MKRTYVFIIEQAINGTWIELNKADSEGKISAKEAEEAIVEFANFFFKAFDDSKDCGIKYSGECEGKTSAFVTYPSFGPVRVRYE